MQEVAARIFKRLDEKGISKKDFAAQLGVSKSTVSNWASGLVTSFTDHIPQISIILEVTTDYLYFGAQPDHGDLTTEEARLLQAYRKADSQAKRIVNTTLEPFGLFLAREKAT